MNKKTFPLLLATALALGACSTNDDANEIDESLKTKIDFTMSDANTGKAFGAKALTRAGFDNATSIAARFVSTDNTNTRSTKTLMSAAAAGTKEYSTVNYAGDTYKRYWDDCLGRAANLSVYAVAVPDQGAALTNNGKSLETLLNGTSSNTWATSEGENTIDWKMSNVQNGTTLANEDLCYSNNIQSTGENGRYVYNFLTPGYPDYSEDLGDGCMQFKLQNNEDATGPGKFDKGHMIFKHATAQISVDIKVGAGFTFTEAKNTFKFTEANKNVELIGFNKTGKLDIKSGEWTNQGDVNIDALKCTTTSDGEALVSGNGLNTIFYNLQGQFIPGKSISSTNNTAAIQLTIDGNTYYISEANIYKALVTDKPGNTTGENPLIKVTENSFKFEQGKNYKFTITIGKTGIDDLTATLIPWAEVNASELTPNNGRIELVTKLFSGDGITTETANDAFNLYRALDEANEISDTYKGYNWKTGYNTNGAATLSYAPSKYSTNWYWESNKSYYHFRTLKGNVTAATTDAGGDYFTMTSGPTASTDYIWGATFKNGISKIDYDETNGFDIMSGDVHTQLTEAIGPLKDDQVINITEQHMMSNIKVILKTVEGAEGVTLYDATDPSNPKGATVSLTNYYGQAKVLMGNGLVTPITTGEIVASTDITSPALTTAADYFTTANTVTKPFTYSVVPQKVDRGSTPNRYIGLTIKTPDNNMYYVVADLSAITGTTSSNYKVDKYSGSAITRWYPGYEYTYTIILKKTGIQAITASIVDWAPVTAADKTVTLESKKARNWK